MKSREGSNEYFWELKEGGGIKTVEGGAHCDFPSFFLCLPYVWMDMAWCGIDQVMEGGIEMGNMET